MGALGIALALAGTALGSFGAPGARAAGSDDTILVSGTADADTYPVAVSDGGRHVLFRSSASNLDPAATAGSAQFFAFDRATGAIELVSRATGPAGRAADTVLGADLAADGRRAVFVAAFDGSTTPHVYVRDLAAGRTTLVDRTTAGDVANGSAYDARVSADGRYIAFVSGAPNLGNNGSYQQVYVRDLQTGVTTLASRADGPNGAIATGVDTADYLSFSADGRHVAFVDSGSSLTNDTIPANSTQLYVRDLDRNHTELVSRATGANGAANTINVNNETGLSGDGRYATFMAWGPAVQPGIPAGIVHIYVRDRVSGTTTLVDRADGPGGAFSGSALTASISADGRVVAFGAYGPGMVPDATLTGWGVYVRDLVAGTTRLAARGPGAGAPAANADTRYSRLSRDGRALAFTTSADNLLPGVGGAKQTYLRTLTGDAPLALTAPAITGARRLGEPLRCGTGTWGNDAPALAFAWLRDGTAIPGATSDTYTSTTADLDLPLTCRVTATNRGGSASADSAPATVPTPGRDGAAGPAGPAGPTGAPAGSGGPAGSPPRPVAAQARLAVVLADARRTTRRGRTVTLRYATTDAARLTATAARSGGGRATRLATATARRAGRGAIKMKVSLAPGTYRLTVTATAGGGRRATDALTLVVRR